MLAEFSVVPTDKGESVSKYVAEILDIIDQSGLEYQLNPMGTTVEGTCDEVFELIKLCHNTMRMYSNRVVTHIAIDDRGGAENRIEGKPNSIEKILGRKLKR